MLNASLPTVATNANKCLHCEEVEFAAYAPPTRTETQQHNNTNNTTLTRKCRRFPTLTQFL